MKSPRARPSFEKLSFAQSKTAVERSARSDGGDLEREEERMAEALATMSNACIGGELKSSMQNTTTLI